MRQFRNKSTKQFSLSQTYEMLQTRLENLKQAKLQYDQTFPIQQQKETKAKEKIIKQIEYNEPLLIIHNKQYDLSKCQFKEQIIQNIDNIDKILDNPASHLVDLRYLSSIEFYLLINELGVDNTQHFSQTDICTICQFELFEIDDWKDFSKISQYDQIIVGLSCDHFYHQDCLNHCIKEQHLQCPICGKIYGIKTGDQPEGEMIIYIDHNTHCDTYENVGTIIIEYRMYQGIRNGNQFPSTTREAFLPDIPEGRQVLRLLKTAFERKLIFTVGRSVTTGKDNRIVWNGIHHKTNLYGGTSYFGYPDPTYFNRVKEELAAKGIF